MSQPASGDWFRIAELTQDAESQTTSLPLQDAEVQMGLQSQDAQIQTLSSNKAPSMVFGGVGLLAGAACMGAAWWWHAKRGWDVTHVSTPETDTDIKPAEAGMRKKNQRADESSGLSGAASTHAEDSAPRGPCCTALQPAEASKPNLPQCLDGGSIQDLQSLDEGSALWGAASTHAEHSALRGPCCTARQPAEASMQHPPQSLDERSAVSGAAGKHTEDATASWAWKAWTQRLGISPLGAALQPPPFPEVDDPLLMVGVGATCFVAAAVLARRQRRPMMGVLRQVEKVDARLNAFAGQAQHDHQSFDQQLSQVSQKMDAVHKLLQQERSLEIQTIRQKHESEIQALNTSMEDKLQKQQKDAADEIKRQQDRHEEASKVAQDVQAQHEDTTAQLAAARNELHRKTESEMEAAQLASQYQQAVAALQKEGQMKQDELADAQGKLQQALEEEKRAKDAASGDQAALRLAQAAREKAEKLAETKESETQAVRAELDEAMKKYEEANKEREQCKKEISQLESDLAKSQQTMREEIEKWKTALDVEKHKHESEIQALNASMEDKLQKQQKDAADEIKRQQDRHEEASKVAQDVQAQHEDTTAQLAAARNELHRKTESEMEAAQLASQYQQVVAALQKEGQRKQDELADAKGKLQQALEEEKCAKDAASGDQAALRLAQAAREKAEKLAETKESETQAARAELDEAMKKYEEANKEREQCKKDISQLESDLEKSQQSMHEEIEKWKTALDDERDAAKQQNDAAEQRLSAARENVEQKQKDLDDAKEALRQADESKEESEQKLKDAEEKHESARKDFLKKIDKLEKDWKEARKDSQARAAELKELKAELQVAKGILQVAQSAHLGESDKAWEGALWHAEQYLEGAVAKEYVEKAASCLPVVWAWTENTDLVQKHDADLQQPNDMVLYSASVSRSLESQYLLWHASKQAEKWSELCVDVGRKIWMEHTGTKYNIFFRDMRQVTSRYQRKVQRFDLASPGITKLKLQEIRKQLEDEIQKCQEAVLAAQDAAKKADQAAKEKEEMCQQARNIEKQWADLPDGKPEGQDKIPLKWEPMNGKDFVQIQLRQEDDEYKEVEKYFKKSCGSKIKKIYRIQNSTLWMAHKSKETLLKKKPLNKGSANVEYFWHSTRDEKVDDAIKKDAGLDTNFAKSTPPGIFLSAAASYSYSLTGSKKAFLCRVLLGYIGQHLNPAHTPVISDGVYADSYHYGKKSSGHRRCETDRTSSIDCQYVVFYNAQVYPAYLVELE